MEKAVHRLAVVMDLFERLGLDLRVTEDIPGLACFSPRNLILISRRFLNQRATERSLDHLTYALLHELAHACQNQTDLYPEMWAFMRKTYDSAEALEAAMIRIDQFEAKNLSLECYADAFAIDLCLRMGMLTVMEFPGYL